MKISEMTLEQLQDYALTLEGEKTNLTNENNALKTKNEELTGYNQALQKRNNELFMKVEQQVVGKDEDEKPADEDKAETCEDFARNLVLNNKI